MRESKELKFANIAPEKFAQSKLLHEAMLAMELISEEYVFIEEAKCIEKLSLMLVATPPVSKSAPVYNSTRLKIIEYNKPSSLNGKQDIQNRAVIKKLSSLESVLDRVTDYNTFSILILYNRGFDEVIIKAYDGIQSYHFKPQDEYQGVNSPVIPDKENNNQESSMFQAIKPKFTFDQVVLNDTLRKEIDRTLTILEKRHIIYNQWNFKSVDIAPKAILNFFGEPGTGKTMAAHAIANQLGCNLIAVNYADIESKYVGDAPKNLLKVFEEASKEQAMLFFDEADSFLGKRISNVTSSSDQSINSLRSQMLILLEDFEGVVIFATNLLKNYDRAFESRIFKHLKFELPDLENRAKIIAKSIPLQVPLFDMSNPLPDKELFELAELAEGFSGRYIKNTILASLTHALVDERESVSFADFIASFENTKQTLKELESERNEVSDSRKKNLGKKIREKLNQANVAPLENISTAPEEVL